MISLLTHSRENMAKKDQTTLSLIKEVQRQKQEIAKAEKPSWNTNMSFSFSERTGTVNLHTVATPTELASIATFLLNQSRSHEEACSLIGVAVPFKWQGFTLGEWIEDIKTRASKIQITEKKNKLEALEKRLNAIISPELKAEMELQAIAEELK